MHRVQLRAIKTLRCEGGEYLDCIRWLNFCNLKLCLTCAGSVWLWTCASFICYHFEHPRGDVIEISSSSYELSLFPSTVGSSHGMGAGSTLGYHQA
jgi:hypothetical protein